MTFPTPPRHLVLYADDDKDDISLVEEAFISAGSDIELVTTYNGEDALSYLTTLTKLDPDPCLIILDVNMPRLNGKETLARIREMERFKKIPVVLFTTSSLNADIKFAEKYNAGFVTKPLDSRQMKNITAKFIEHFTDEARNTVKRRFRD